MYRVLLADDEGIMLYSLQSMIQKEYGSDCEVSTAKTGTAVIEMVESIRPDIIFMDIQMPGMNGIEAMQKIRNKNTSVIFIVITAYDKFDYAKESIEIGVFDFLTKPVTKVHFLHVLKKAMEQIDQDRTNQMSNLRIREKLETVVPIIESGFINNLLLCDPNISEAAFYNYRELLEIQEAYAYVLLIQFGDNLEHGVLTNPVGMSMRSQKFYPVLRQIVKSSFASIVGPLMSNKVVLMIPHAADQVDYVERVQIIEESRQLVHKLENQIDARFRIGIGRNYPMDELNTSYQEANEALQTGKSQIVHVNDLPIHGEYEGNYPIENEHLLFQDILKGDVEGVRNEANDFFDWMVYNYPDYRDDIKLKTLEFVIRAEKEAFMKGTINYGFLSRKNYLTEVNSMGYYEEIRTWFLSKLLEVTKAMSERQEKLSENITDKAKQYILQNYQNEISLEDVSRAVNISPYYFSKKFKEETGITFIDYLTHIRIENSKELLKDSQLSIKEVCALSGYTDPNYFSRIFKKLVNLTPSEYREKVTE